MKIIVSCRFTAFLVLVQLLFVSALFAQTTFISGRVFDAITNEPIPFANVYFKGTTIGATTDMDGNFSIQNENAPDSLTASYVGYNNVSLRIRKGQKQVINFALKASSVELKEVVVKAGKNPALAIIRKTIDNRPENNSDNYNAYQYEVYNKLEFDLTNIDEKFKNRKIFKPFKFIFDNIDSTITNEKPSLPAFISEEVSDFYFRTDPKLKKEVVKGAKISGTENKSVTQFLGDMYTKTNIYDNFFFLFTKGFISPIANIAPVYYKYYLDDSLFIGNQRCYKITFRPRRPEDLAFNGEMYIHDTTFAIKKITMRVSPKANINFVEDVAFVKEFERVENKYWMSKREIMVVYFSPRPDADRLGFIGRKTTSYRDFLINQPKDPKFFNPNLDIETLDDATTKPTEYWDSARHETLTEREKKIYHMVDTVKSLPMYKTYIEVLSTIFTGYKSIGPKLEIGPYFGIYSFNPIEGDRFRMGFRTYDFIHRRLYLNGYGAYGLKDQRFKYGGSAEFLFTEKHPRNSAKIAYSKDVEQLGNVGDLLAENNVFSSTFRRSPNNRLTFYENFDVAYNIEWFPGLSTRLVAGVSSLVPLGKLDYSYYTSDGTTEDVVRSSKVGLYVRWQKGERFVSSEHTRISLGSDNPEIQFEYSLGLKNVFSSGFNFHSFRLKFSDLVYLSPFGYMRVTIQAGKVLGTVPFPLLEVHKGNETYSYVFNSFNLMNYYEFVSDQYASAFVVHHFDGFFLDKVPVFKKLKWREVASVRTVYGSMSEANKKLLVNPQQFQTLQNKPYLEVGAGIENIFKFLRVDAVWRVNYLQNPRVTPFGIRGAFQFQF